MFKCLADPIFAVALSCGLAFASHTAAVSDLTHTDLALSTPEGAREALLANARFLMAKGRPDLARSVIQQVLAIQANDSETLVLLGDLELRSGRSAQALEVLERLQQRDPKGIPTREMEALVRLHSVDRARLVQLRAFHGGGQYPQAQVIARELFPDGKAPGSLGREFADLLEGTTFREPRRTAGMAAPMIRDKRQIKPVSGDRPGTADVALSNGYDALNAGDENRAEENFKRVLKLRPRSAAAYGGLGIVHARRGQHADAVAYYGQAQQREKNRQSNPWIALARTSSYWQLMASAREQLDRSDYLEARETLRLALLSQPQEPEAAVLLAEADLSQSRNAVAASAYEALTQRTPADPRVWRGWLASLMRQSTATAESLDRAWTEAEAAADTHRLNRADLLAIGDVRALARRQRDAGEPKMAADTMDRALRFAPADAWLRHDRARLFLEQGDAAQASRLMREGDRLAPLAPAMKHALAIIAMAQEQAQIALESIEGIPESLRTPSMKELADSARFELVMHRLQHLSRSGTLSEATPSLVEAGTLVRDDASRQLRVARAEMVLGAREAGTTRLADMDVSKLSSQDRVARAVLLSDAGHLLDAAQALGRLVADWSATVPARVLINAQTLVASRRIGDFLAMNSLESAREVAAQAFADWDRAGKRTALVSAAQAKLWLQAQSAPLALESANAALEDDPSSAAAMLVRARVRAATGDSEGARADLRQLDSILPLAAVEERLEAVQVWTALKERETAHRWLTPLLSRQPGNANLRLEAARIARLGGDDAAALQHLRFASSFLASSDAMAAASSVNELRSLDAVREAIASIEARRQPRFEIGASQFGQAGDAGISRIKGQEWTAAVYWPVNYQGHVFGQVDRVRLDAGTLPALNGQARAFGQVAALPGAANLASPMPQTDEAYSVGMGWIDEVSRVDIGVVGVGLNRSSVTAGWREDFKLGGRDAALDVSRRVETSSLLTYAGARDPVSDQVWGGITNNSIALRISEELPDGWLRSATARLGIMSGSRVETNPFIQLQGRWTRAIHSSPNGSALTGVVLNLWHYKDNRSGFTFGQGGYYSPQHYASVQLPLEIAHRAGPWTHALRGHLTLAWAKEAAAPYFPQDAALQRAAANPITAANTTHGLGLALKTNSEYRFDPFWSLGATAEWERSRDYNPYRVGIYLRHYFNGATGPSPLPPKPLEPYAQF